MISWNEKDGNGVILRTFTARKHTWRNDPANQLTAKQQKRLYGSCYERKRHYDCPGNYVSRQGRNLRQGCDQNRGNNVREVGKLSVFPNYAKTQAGRGRVQGCKTTKKQKSRRQKRIAQLRSKNRIKYRKLQPDQIFQVSPRCPIT